MSLKAKSPTTPSGQRISANPPAMASKLVHGDDSVVPSSQPTIISPVNGNGSHLSSDLDKVAILDAGAQYGKVIDRRVRELNVYTEMLPLETPLSYLLENKFKCIIISGGPSSVYSENALTYDDQIFFGELPVLGICYGFQLLNKAFGGSVAKTQRRNDGQTQITVNSTSPLFRGMDSVQNVLLTHGDSVIEVPQEMNVIAQYHDLVVGISNDEKRKYGVQFHPEVDLTEHGMEIFKNFLFKICNIRANFLMTNREHECVQFIKSNVRDKKVLLLASGGVDSTVCAALLRKCIPQEQMIVLHINNGFMRKNESADVIASLEKLGVKVEYRDCSDRFRYARRRRPDDTMEGSFISPLLMETVDPEEKRKIIGDTFMDVANYVIREELKLDESNVLLCQGTLRPDLIESSSQLASKHAEAIKTHHNDTDFVRELRNKGRVIEPLKDFHKDEVRRIGKDLGLPDAIVQRHPFPGPGLAVRVICATEPWRARDYDKTVMLLRILCTFSSPTWHLSVMHETVKQILTREEVEFLMHSTKEHTIVGHVLPIRSVGVQGDGRSFKHVAALMTEQSPVPWNVLFRLAEIIPRVCQSISRVAYVFGPVISHEIETVTETLLVPHLVLNKLQECDHVAQKVLWDSGYYNRLAQMPVIVIPVVFDADTAEPNPNCPNRQHSIVLRPFISNDFMTGIAAIPGKHIPEKVVLDMVQAVKNVCGVSRVLYDMTCKPPGTTEWE